MINKMIAKALTLSTEGLKAEAAKMSASAEDYAGDVLMALLGALETRMPENEFVAFCDSL